jgi:hypothetical protein
LAVLSILIAVSQSKTELARECDVVESNEQAGGRQPEKPKPTKPPKPYKLNVQGVTIEWAEPAITVKAAMEEAGFDTSQPWIMILRVAGQPKRPVELDTIIDLTDPGVEKLRLTPKQISNGEGPMRRQEFDLLPADETFLERAGFFWETFTEAGVRWLLIHGYPVPAGYDQTSFSLALQIPITYPAGQIDMFYCYPHLALVSGGSIPKTQHRVAVLGQPYQRWSRHRPNGGWDRHKDNVVTHLALVEESLLREVES